MQRKVLASLLLLAALLIGSSMVAPFLSRALRWGSRVAMYSISIDDISGDFAFDFVYDKVYPYLEARGMVATLYVITHEDMHSFSSSSLNKMKELVSKGWAIGGHSMHHIDNWKVISVAEAEDEAKGCYDLLVKAGFHPPFTFSYPGGNPSGVAMKVVSKYYVGARGVGDRTYRYPMSFSDRYNYKFPDAGADFYPYHKKKIDEAISDKKWYGIFFHPNENEWAAAKRVIDYVYSRKNEIKVLTERDFFAYYFSTYPYNLPLSVRHLTSSRILVKIENSS